MAPRTFRKIIVMGVMTFSLIESSSLIAALFTPEGRLSDSGKLAQLGRRRAKRKAEENTRPPTTCGGTLNIGFQIHTFAPGVRGAVWYPSTAAEVPYTYPGGFTSTVALDAPVAPCGRYPLVVFSHGYTGCSIQSVFFTEALAHAGYIVAAPDHKDSECKVDQPTRFSLLSRADAPNKQPNYTDATYRDRQQDMEAVLDEMLRDSRFGASIDANRIAGAGHSLGGYTILGLAGAWPSWKDNRIKAALLLSPYLKPYLENGGLRAVHIPVMYQGGTRDFTITPRVNKPGGAYDVSNQPKYYVEFKGAGHLDWSNLACLFRKFVPACAADAEKPRLIDEYGIAFLDRYMKGRPEPILDRPNPELADARHAD